MLRTMWARARRARSSSAATSGPARLVSLLTGYLLVSLISPVVTRDVLVRARNHRRGERRHHLQWSGAARHRGVVQADGDVGRGSRFEGDGARRRYQLAVAGDDVDDLLLGGVDVARGSRPRRERRPADREVAGIGGLGADV